MFIDDARVILFKMYFEHMGKCIGIVRPIVSYPEASLFLLLSERLAIGNL